ncbi:MAG: hypothetical protein A3F80_01540 [Candidatus Melainabacteria bacterium RIFCSPLOWO2_12_FULL_35_11]|nr:MAG: hypothetical protein A3F80_01540 [Candidatus Melainabacteria bacterium RIFCSPLOWO2_12_FULL_35_11]
MNEQNLKVLIINDNPADVSLINEYLKNECVCEVTIANSLYSGIALALEKIVDLVLLDLVLPDSTGFETFYEFYSSYHNKPVIIFTSLDDEDTVVRAIQSGAQGYFIKGEVSAKQIVRTLRYTHEKFKNNNRELGLAREIINEAGITSRELEILSLLAKGETNKKISSVLYLTTSTIRNHISNIFKKLGISNRSQAVAIAIQAGLLKEKNENMDFSHVKPAKYNNKWSITRIR